MIKKSSKCVFHLDNPHLLSKSLKITLKSTIQKLLSTQISNSQTFFLYKNTSVSENSKLQSSKYLNDFFQTSQIKPSQIVFPYEYLKDSILSYNKFPNDIILLCGEEDQINEIAKELNYSNYLTMSEYCKIFPILVPISKRNKESNSMTKAKILSRMPFLKNDDFEFPLQIKAVYFLQDVTEWEEYGQVITDLLSTENGKIAKKFPENPPKEHIPIYFANSEIHSFDKSGNQILGLGALKETLNTCYKLIYKKDLIFNKDDHVLPEKRILEYIGRNIF